MKTYSKPKLRRYRSNGAVTEYPVSTGVQVTKCSIPGMCAGGGMGGRGLAAPPPWLIEPYH